jgi:hypothetical protein
MVSGDPSKKIVMKIKYSYLNSQNSEVKNLILGIIF